MNESRTALVPTTVRFDLPISPDDDRWRASWDPETRRAEVTLSEHAAARLSPILELVEVAETFDVQAPEDREMVVEWARAFPLRLEETLRDVFAEVTALANGLHKGLTAKRAEYAELIDLAKRLTAEKVEAYDRRVAAERAGAERKARDEAARLEREALLAAAPSVMAAAVSYAARCAVEDEERRAAAKAAEDAGDREAAEVMLAEVGRHDPQPQLPLPQVPAAPPAAIPPEPERKGTVRRANWKAECVDFAALVSWVAKDIPARMHILEVDQAAADREAKNHRERLTEVIPGLRAVDAGRLGFRRA